MAACGIQKEATFAVMLFRTSGEHNPMLLSGHSGPIVHVAFSPDDKWLATASWDGRVGLWDARTGRRTAFLRGHKGGVQRVAFAPDGRTLASSGDDATIRFWNLASLQEAGTLHGHKANVQCIAFSENGKYLASTSVDELKIWRAPTFEEISQKEKGSK